MNEVKSLNAVTWKKTRERGDNVLSGLKGFRSKLEYLAPLAFLAEYNLSTFDR